MNDDEEEEEETAAAAEWTPLSSHSVPFGWVYVVWAP